MSVPLRPSGKRKSVSVPLRGRKPYKYSKARHHRLALGFIRRKIMNSDKVKAGVEHAPHRSLLKADGYNDEQMRRPFIGVVNSFNEVAPGHMHLQTIARAVKDGVLAAGGTPMEFNTIGVCDGIAMGHDGMHFSLSSRELIADTIECMVKAHCFDALVFIPNCDKIVPGMLMAAMRLNLPCWSQKSKSYQRRRTRGDRGKLLPGLRFLFRYVHGKLHELLNRGSWPRPSGKWYDPGCIR